MASHKNNNTEFLKTIHHLNILNELIEGVQILDFDLNYLYLNEAAIQQSGRIKEDLLGRNFVDAWPGVEKTKLFQTMQNCSKQHCSFDLENEFEFQEGKSGWFLLQIQPISCGILIMSLDITERKKNELKIRENEIFYRSLFDNLLNGFAYCKMLYENNEPVDFQFITTNRAFQELSRLSNVDGKLFSELFPGAKETDSQLLLIFERVVKNEKTETFEYYFNATQDWLLITVYSPQKDAFVFIFEVITEQKSIEQKTREQIDELRRWYEATLDRENRNIELKKEVNQLLIEAGKPKRYTEE